MWRGWQRRALGWLGMLALLVGVPKALSANLTFGSVPPERVHAAFAMNPPTTALRRAALGKLFAQAGCTGPDLLEQPVPGAGEPNLICRMTGLEGKSTIVIGARYDKDDESAADTSNWSGAAMLPLLYESLFIGERRDNFILVAFAGRRGAKTFVKEMDKRTRRGMDVMIELRNLGRGLPAYTLPTHDMSDPPRYNRMVLLFLRAAEIDGITPLPKEAKDLALPQQDTIDPFLSAFISAITLQSGPADAGSLPARAGPPVSSHARNLYDESLQLITIYALTLDRFSQQYMDEELLREARERRTPRDASSPGILAGAAPAPSSSSQPAPASPSPAPPAAPKHGHSESTPMTVAQRTGGHTAD